jgi:RNA polymerase sigma-70 factor (ECF subfamily)
MTALVPPRGPASSPGDGELVAAALRDKAAYALIVRRWEAALSRYVSRLAGRHGSATEDILQEVFLKAYLNLNDYDRSRPFGSWIYRIARNQAFDFLRKRKAEPTFVTGEDAALILERLIGDGASQETWDEIRTEEQVRAAIASLDHRYREVMVLRYLEEKGYDEISDILEIPPGTVATLIRRGSEKLRGALRVLGFDVTSRGPA